MYGGDIEICDCEIAAGGCDESEIPFLNTGNLTHWCRRQRVQWLSCSIAKGDICHCTSLHLPNLRLMGRGFGASELVFVIINSNLRDCILNIKNTFQI